MGILKALMTREILPPKAAVKEQPRIPRILRSCMIVYNEPHESAVQKYGWWTIKLLTDSMVHGQLIPAGAEIKVTGNIGFQLAVTGDAVFCDEKLEQEERALEEVRRLGLDSPPSPRNSEAFQPQRREKRPWVAA